MNRIYFKNLIFCYYFLIFVTTVRFLSEELLLGLEGHFFLIFHHHYWYFLVLLVCIFWFSVFLKKTFMELYWLVFFMPVTLVPMICCAILDNSKGLTYLKGENFLENLKHIATFLLLHRDNLPISAELIMVFGATLIYTFIVSKSVWKSFANAVFCYISIICIGTNFISPFSSEALFAARTFLPDQMWMAFKYMSYVFIMIFVLFRHQIIGFYKSNRRFRISGIIIFSLVELFFIAFFGIRPFLQNHCFYFADIFVTLVPAAVVSQTLNLLFFTKINDFVFRKLFLAFHTLVIFTIILFYWTGWYFYIGSGYQEGFSEEVAENLQKEDKYIYDTVIVGGGLAGLKAANDLKDYNILLLEKENRLGGRVLTERCGKNNSDFCELGALFGFSEELIPEGFEIGEKIPANKKYGIYQNGRFYKNSDVKLALRSINPKDARFFDKYDKPEDIDKLFQNVSDNSKKALKAAFNVIHPGNFEEYTNQRKHNALTTFNFDQYAGGNSALIEAYGVAINNRFLLNSEVTSVESKDGIVTVQYNEAGQPKEIKAKSVIVATPAGVARKIIKNMNKNAEIFLNSVRYGKGMAVVFEVNKNNPDNFAYLITPDNSFNTIFFNNTADGKREVLTLYFIDSFVSANPQLNEQDYIKIAKEELYKTGIFNEKTEFFYENARFWKELGTIITKYYYGFTEDALNPGKGIYLAGDYTFYNKDENPYGLEAAFFSGEAAAERVVKYLNRSKARKKEKAVQPKIAKITVQDNPFSTASYMFDEKYNLTHCSRYKIVDEKPEFISTFEEGNIALYALIAQAANDKELARKVADARTDDFQWEYGYKYGGTSFDSSIVLESLVSLEVEKDTVRKSLESLKKIYFRKDEGCFATLPENVGRSAYWQGCSADITSHLGWIFYKSDPEKYSELASSCAEYVKNVINSGSESKFKSKWFPSNFLTPYYAARLLGIVGEKYQKELNIIEKYLMSKQKENGSFSDSVIETSYAVLAMKTIENKELLPNIEKAENWLRNNENRLPEPILYYWLDSNENPDTKIFFSCYDKGLISEAYKKMALEK